MGVFHHALCFLQDQLLISKDKSRGAYFPIQELPDPILGRNCRAPQSLKEKLVLFHEFREVAIEHLLSDRSVSYPGNRDVLGIRYGKIAPDFVDVLDLGGKL